MHGLPYVPDSRVAVALPAVRRAIAETREALRRVSEQQALALIGVIGMSRKSAHMTDLDAQARVAAMLDEWRDIPADILRDAVDEFRRSGDARDDWMPTGGRIRALAMPALNRRMMRLRNLLDLEADLQRRQERIAALARDPSPETLAAIEAIRGRG